MPFSDATQFGSITKRFDRFFSVVMHAESLESTNEIQFLIDLVLGVAVTVT